MKTKTVIIIAFTSILIVWGSYPFLISLPSLKSAFPAANWGELGTIGDSFGALNSLFSGLALAGLAVTINLQAKELRKLQEKEKETSNTVLHQSKILKATALLQYFNSEIDRLERLSKDVSPESPINESFWARFDELQKKRESVIKEMEIQSTPL